MGNPRSQNSNTNCTLTTFAHPLEIDDRHSGRRVCPRFVWGRNPKRTPHTAAIRFVFQHMLSDRMNPLTDIPLPGELSQIETAIDSQIQSPCKTCAERNERDDLRLRSATARNSLMRTQQRQLGYAFGLGNEDTRAMPPAQRFPNPRKRIRSNRGTKTANIDQAKGKLFLLRGKRGHTRGCVLQEQGMAYSNWSFEGPIHTHQCCSFQISVCRIRREGTISPSMLGKRETRVSSPQTPNTNAQRAHLRVSKKQP